MNHPLIEVSAAVHAAPDTVTTSLISRLMQQARDSHAHIEADRTRRHIILQGGWWYRGEYIVQPDPAGSRIIHRVYNAARQARWAVPLANRLFIGFRRRTEESFAVLIDQIADETRAQG